MSKHQGTDIPPSTADAEPSTTAEASHGTSSGTGKLTRLRWPAKMAYALFCLVLFCGLGEVALRLAGQGRPIPDPPLCRRPELFQEFVDYGYALRPSRTMTYDYPKRNPRRLTLTSNAAGFRSDREFHESDPRTRIVVVGDSFVFGEGVEASERFTNLIEANEPGWRVDNLGMNGFGPGLMLRALETLGLDPSPDVVVFCMYTYDFRRIRPFYAGAGFKIPRYKIKSNRLRSVPYPTIHWWDHLAATKAIRRIQWKFGSEQLRLNRAILDRFLQLASKHDFIPALVFLPGAADTPTDQAKRTWLRAYAEKHNVAFADLTDAIHATKDAFIPGNPHWNPAGHKTAATEIRRLLAGIVRK